MLTLENYKDIQNYEGCYQISNLGNVKSLPRKTNNQFCKKERVLKPGINSRGYLMVDLSKNGKKTTRTVHQLVAEAFLNHKPNGHTLVCNHKNFIKTDNRAENLEIVTHRENSNFKHIKSSSQYTGVCWYKREKKWLAQIWINGKSKYLGIFTDEIEASKAYQKELNKITKTL